MSKVITFSRYFPAHHPRKGEPTYFVEAILTQLGIDYTSHEYFMWLVENNKDVSEIFLNDFFMSLSQDIEPKSHTIRNHKRPVIVGGSLNPKCWAGKPYHKTPEGFWQIKFAPDIEVKKVWDIEIVDLRGVHCIRLNNQPFGQFHPLAEGTQKIAKNDGLTAIELIQWFSSPSPTGKKFQIICWNENINY
jgi:hypothetical protein